MAADQGPAVERRKRALLKDLMQYEIQEPGNIFVVADPEKRELCFSFRKVFFKPTNHCRRSERRLEFDVSNCPTGEQALKFFSHSDIAKKHFDVDAHLGEKGKAQVAFSVSMLGCMVDWASNFDREPNLLAALRKTNIAYDRIKVLKADRSAFSGFHDEFPLTLQSLRDEFESRVEWNQTSGKPGINAIAKQKKQLTFPGKNWFIGWNDDQKDDAVNPNEGVAEPKDPSSGDDPSGDDSSGDDQSDHKISVDKNVPGGSTVTPPSPQPENMVNFDEVFGRMPSWDRNGSRPPRPNDHSPKPPTSAGKFDEWVRARRADENATGGPNSAQSVRVSLPVSTENETWPNILIKDIELRGDTLALQLLFGRCADLSKVTIESQVDFKTVKTAQVTANNISPIFINSRARAKDAFTGTAADIILGEEVSKNTPVVILIDEKEVDSYAKHIYGDRKDTHVLALINREGVETFGGVNVGHARAAALALAAGLQLPRVWFHDDNVAVMAEWKSKGKAGQGLWEVHGDTWRRSLMTAEKLMDNTGTVVGLVGFTTFRGFHNTNAVAARDDFVHKIVLLNVAEVRKHNGLRYKVDDLMRLEDVHFWKACGEVRNPRVRCLKITKFALLRHRLPKGGIQSAVGNRGAFLESVLDKCRQRITTERAAQANQNPGRGGMAAEERRKIEKEILQANRFKEAHEVPVQSDERPTKDRLENIFRVVEQAAVLITKLRQSYISLARTDDGTDVLLFHQCGDVLSVIATVYEREVNTVILCLRAYQNWKEKGMDREPPPPSIYDWLFGMLVGKICHSRARGPSPNIGLLEYAWANHSHPHLLDKENKFVDDQLETLFARAPDVDGPGRIKHMIDSLKSKVLTRLQQDGDDEWHGIDDETMSNFLNILNLADQQVDESLQKRNRVALKLATMGTKSQWTWDGVKINLETDVQFMRNLALDMSALFHIALLERRGHCINVEKFAADFARNCEVVPFSKMAVQHGTFEDFCAFAKQVTELTKSDADKKLLSSKLDLFEYFIPVLEKFPLLTNDDLQSLLSLFSVKKPNSPKTDSAGKLVEKLMGLKVRRDTSEGRSLQKDMERAG